MPCWVTVFLGFTAFCVSPFGSEACEPWSGHHYGGRFRQLLGRFPRCAIMVVKIGRMKIEPLCKKKKKKKKKF
ncbi:hypothetical protein F4804DRAFT_324691, partial [Jackrogersella minutella]